jgi:ADP-ribose pyrophosphatase YjhB (NUDIX family)
MGEPEWLSIARELNAMAQIGLTYCSDKFCMQRYERLRDLAASMMATGSRMDKTLILDLFRHDLGYPTPRVDVRGAVFQNDRILLVQEVEDRRWSLPGGWADVNQTASECVVREIAEEAGFETRTIKLAAVLDRSRHGHVPLHPHYVYKMYFLCELTGGSARPGLESLAVEFFSLDALPDLSLSRTTHRQIERMFEHHRKPNLPTDFD